MSDTGTEGDDGSESGDFFFNFTVKLCSAVFVNQ